MKFPIVSLLCLLMAVNAFAFGKTKPKPTENMSDLLNILDQRLPSEKESYGRDKNGNQCVVIVDRLAPLVRVSIMPAWGGFSVLREDDGSQTLEEFQVTDTLLHAKVITSKSVAGASATSYTVLTIKRVGANMVQYFVGSILDMQKPNPTIFDCTVGQK